MLVASLAFIFLFLEFTLVDLFLLASIVQVICGSARLLLRGFFELAQVVVSRNDEALAE